MKFRLVDGTIINAPSVEAVKAYVQKNKEPRGIRNNNPGNIKINSGNEWLGKISDNTDGTFEQFQRPEHGIRAIAKILSTYQDRGFNTVEGMIGRWSATDKEEEYIKNVSENILLDPDDKVNLEDDTTFLKIVKAIIIQENGKNPYDDELIMDAISSAKGVEEDPQQTTDNEIADAKPGDEFQDDSGNTWVLKERGN